MVRATSKSWPRVRIGCKISSCLGGQAEMVALWKELRLLHRTCVRIGAGARIAVGAVVVVIGRNPAVGRALLAAGTSDGRPRRLAGRFASTVLLDCRRSLMRCLTERRG